MPPSSNVFVYSRFRPLNSRELKNPDNQQQVYNVTPSETAISYLNPSSLDSGHSTFKDFTFDHVFDTPATQRDIFERVGQPICDELFKGFNCTIMAYGLTGSGKTHTMMGSTTGGEHIGLIPRVVEEIFAYSTRQAAASSPVQVEVKASYVQIYMEKIQDLVNPKLTNLRLRELVGSKTSTVYIEGCSVCTVKTSQDLMRFIQRGEKNRTTGETNMNAHSSRSHSVLVLSVSQTDEAQEVRKTSKLFLVDLAGSEQVGRTGASGLTLRQAQAINKSLSTLAMVIHKLTEPRSRGSKAHIPYRDSKLTRLLSDSLGGNSKTALILACSPAYDSVRETYSTLQFGQRAKRLKNEAKINQQLSVSYYQKRIQQLEAELAGRETTHALGQAQAENETNLELLGQLGLENEQLKRQLTELQTWRSQAADATQEQVDHALKQYFEQLERNQTLEQSLQQVRDDFTQKLTLAQQEQERLCGVIRVQQVERQRLVETKLQLEEKLSAALTPIEMQAHESDVSEGDLGAEEEVAGPTMGQDLSILQTSNLVVVGMDNFFNFETF